MKIYILDANQLCNENIFKQYYDRCSLIRKEKIDKKKQPQDRRLSLGSEILLMKGLSDFGISDYKVFLTDSGKPYLIDNKMYFSLSHSGTYSFAVFSDSEVGIDAEKCRAISDQLLKDTFSPEENIFLSELVSKVAEKNFLKLWTRKEAVSKFSSKPLSCVLSNINVLNDKFTLDTQKLSLLTFLMDDYCISLCSDKPLNDLKIIKVKL